MTFDCAGLSRRIIPGQTGSPALLHRILQKVLNVFRELADESQFIIIQCRTSALSIMIGTTRASAWISSGVLACIFASAPMATFMRS